MKNKMDRSLSIIGPFKKSQSKYWKQIYELRYNIAIVEQQISKQDEFDDSDNENCCYFVGFLCDELIATCRVENDSESTDGSVARIERVAVKKEYRSRGFGRNIIDAAEDYIRMQKKYKKITITSQLQASKFYAKLGYSQFGEIKIIIGIPHIEMIKLI